MKKITKEEVNKLRKEKTIDLLLSIIEEKINYKTNYPVHLYFDHNNNSLSIEEAGDEINFSVVYIVSNIDLFTINLVNFLEYNEFFAITSYEDLFNKLTNEEVNI